MKENVEYTEFTVQMWTRAGLWRKHLTCDSLIDSKPKLRKLSFYKINVVEQEKLQIIKLWNGLRWKGSLKLIQPKDKQGHLQLNQVIQGPIQPDLEYFQE